VDEYKYLGRLLTPGNEMAKEINQRVTSGWRRFVQYSTFLKEKKIPMCQGDQPKSNIRLEKVRSVQHLPKGEEDSHVPEREDYDCSYNTSYDL